MASSSGAISADALTDYGSSDLYAASTSGGSTSIYETTNGGANWTMLASGLTGTIEGLVSNATDVVAVTLSGLALTSFVYSISGTLVGSSAQLSLAGSGISAVSGVAFAAEPLGVLWHFAITASALGPNDIEVATSVDGIHYTAFSEIATFNSTIPNSALSSIGATRLYPAGGIPGQIALTKVSAGMLLLYTTRVNGEVTANLLVSPRGGTSWLGPYRIGSTPGTVQDPELTPSLAGTVYATWRDVANGTGTVVEAILAPNGDVLDAPAAIPGSSSSGLSPIGGPSIGIDALQRPLLVWPAVNLASPGQDVLAYSGGYLDASVAVSEVNQIISDPLAPADFDTGAPSNESQSLQAEVANTVNTINGYLSSAAKGNQSGYCNAQNATLLTLYAKVTRIPLGYSGSGTVCASFTFAQLHPQTSLVAPTLGPLTPNTYLADYVDSALEALGVTVTLSPLAAAADAVQPSSDKFTATPEWFTPPTVPVTNSTTVNGPSWDDVGKVETVTVTPTVFSPTALQLSISATAVPSFPGSATRETCSKGIYTYTPDTTPAKTWVNVSLNNGTIDAFTGGSSFASSMFLTNLTPANNGSKFDFWSASFSVRYVSRFTVDDLTPSKYCPYTNGTYPMAPSPSGFGPVRTSGVFWTELTVEPSYDGSSFVTAAAKNNTLSVGWTNTADANDTLSLINETTRLDQQSEGPTSLFASPESYPFPIPGAMGDTYTLTLTGTSLPGGWLASETPAFSAGTYGTYPAETATDTCVFTLSPPSENLTKGSGYFTNVTSTSATIIWNATGSSAGPGFVRYYAVGTGVNLTDDQVNFSSPGSGLYRYVAQLHGLYPWTFYSFTYGITSYPSGGKNGCLTYVNQTTSPTDFLTNYTFPLWEQDQPYDSISHTGGGASIGWELPAWFLADNPTWVSGSLNYTNGSGSSVGIPLSPSEISSTSSTGFEITLQLPQPGASYSVNASLVYEIGSTKYYAFSPVLSFVYLRDTSGDGLTDVEKIDGWGVTSESATGAWSTETVSANPALYATNGLVNDYLEKEFGLNPDTIDTASSHMLDTWNLTFQLPNASCPAGFECWYENGSNPFSYNATPTGVNHGGTPIVTNSTSVPCWSQGGLQDDAPYDAEVLWASPSLSVLQTLITSEHVGWLRGVIMHGYSTDWTLTVWGKLSWGANPLAASTPLDGIADGQRVNPLYEVGIEFHSVYANGTGLNTGTGYAVYFGYTYWDAAHGTPRTIGNYSSQAIEGGTGGNPSSIVNYVATLPAPQTSPNVTFVLQVIANESSGLTDLELNGSAITVLVFYNLITGGPTPVKVSGNSANLNGMFQEVPMGVKASTWLWKPTSNSTVNGLPTGLERYTGEQSFDLVVVNASSTVTSDPVPLPWGGTASGVALSTGLNDFLIPREQFLSSPFGQAIFLGRSTSFNASTGAPPLVGASEQGLISTFNGANWMVNLSAYWQNRAILSGTRGNITPTTEAGTAAGNSLEIQVLSATTSSGANTGGLPSNPTLYATVGDPSALQAIVTLNITSTATLDLLLAALLDNTTGGTNAVNGTFQSVTFQVGFLGLDSAVVNAICNKTEPSDGLYGAPASQPPKSQSSGFWGNLWNAVTSFVMNPLGTVLSLINTGWGYAQAAFTYFNHLAHEAGAIGGSVLTRVAATLVSVGKFLLATLQELATFVLNAMRAILQAVLSPLLSVASAYDSSNAASLNESIADVQAGHQVSNAHASSVASSLSGSVIVLALALAIAIQGLITVASAVEIGPGLIVSMILSIIILGAIAAFSRVSAASLLEESAIWAVDQATNLSISSNSGSGIQVNWKALAESIGAAASFPSISLAIWIGGQLPLNQMMKATAALVLAMIAGVVEFVVWASHLTILVILALSLATISTVLAVSFVSLAPAGPLKYWGYVALGFAAAADGAAFGDALTLL